MAKTATLKDVSSGYTSGTKLNDNFTALNDKFNNTISRDGSTPNNMEADLDLDSNNILNVNKIEVNSLVVDGVPVTTSGTIVSDIQAITKAYSGVTLTNPLTLPVTPINTSSVLVFFDGVLQHLGTYSIVGTSLTFADGIPADTEEAIVFISAEATVIGPFTDITVSGTSGTAKIGVTESTASSAEYRTLLSLVNYGRPGIVMGNTETNDEWEISAGTNLLFKYGALGSVSTAKDVWLRVHGDGSVVESTIPWQVPAYTVATVPDAGVAVRSLIFVTDESGGAVVAFSDGTNWRRVTDRAIIS